MLCYARYTRIRHATLRPRAFYLRLCVFPRVLPKEVFELDVPVHDVVVVAVAHGVHNLLHYTRRLQRHSDYITRNKTDVTVF